MPLDLDAIQARADAATPGPWWQSGPPWFASDTDVLAFSEDPHVGEFVADCEIAMVHLDDEDKLSVGQRSANATFIAHARTDVPALVAELRAAREVIQTYRDATHVIGIDAVDAAVATYDKLTEETPDG